MMRRSALVATALLLAVTGCSGSDDDAGGQEGAATPTYRPTTSSSQGSQGKSCEVIATVAGTGYHERGVLGEYEADTTAPVTGTVAPCKGAQGSPATFYPVVGVRQKWALVTKVGDTVLFFVWDRLPPISTEDPFARILIGDAVDED